MVWSSHMLCVDSVVVVFSWTYYGTPGNPSVSGIGGQFVLFTVCRTSGTECSTESFALATLVCIGYTWPATWPYDWSIPQATLVNGCIGRLVSGDRSANTTSSVFHVQETLLCWTLLCKASSGRAPRTSSCVSAAPHVWQALHSLQDQGIQYGVRV